MNEEFLKSMMDGFMEKAITAYNLKEAMDKNLPFYQANRKTFIVPTRMINDALGVEDDKMMPREAVPILKKLGWKRTVRGVYSGGKVVDNISCWIFNK